MSKSKRRAQLLKELKEAIDGTDPAEGKAVLDSLPKLDDGQGTVAIGVGKKKKGKK
jgi:hypothetical protein